MLGTSIFATSYESVIISKQTEKKIKAFNANWYPGMDPATEKGH